MSRTVREARAAAELQRPAGTLLPPAPRDRFDVHGNDGTRLNVELFGPQDAPTIVLAHGWTCSIGFWARELGALGGEFRVVAYDQRGHGASGLPGPAGYTIDAVADDLAAVLRATVPAGERAVLAGHSMGAMAAIALGTRRPEVLLDTVSSALLCSTGMHELVVRNGIVPLPLPLARLSRPVSARVMAISPPGGRVDDRLRAVIRYVTLSRGATAAEVDFCARIVAATPPRVSRGFARMLATLDLDDAVTRFPLPAQVLAGTKDRLTPIWHARRMAERLPHSLGLVEVPGKGHMTPVEAADDVVAAVRALVPAGTGTAGPQRKETA